MLTKQQGVVGLHEHTCHTSARFLLVHWRWEHSSPIRVGSNIGEGLVLWCWGHSLLSTLGRNSEDALDLCWWWTWLNSGGRRLIPLVMLHPLTGHRAMHRTWRRVHVPGVWRWLVQRRSRLTGLWSDEACSRVAWLWSADTCRRAW